MHKDNSTFELDIPTFNITLSHNSFISDRVMKPIIWHDFSFFGRIGVDPLFLITDWEIYEYIYLDFQYYNETDNPDQTDVTRFNSSFVVGEDKVILEVERFIDILIPGNRNSYYENSYKHVTIDKKSGVVDRLEWQIQPQRDGP